MLSRSLLVVVLIALAAAAAQAAPRRFEISPNAFLLDGKPIQLISGELRYGRIPPEYWLDRIHKARAMGLNAITIYCFWNLHEPESDQWNFKGFGDVAAFCRIAQQEGLLVILRPGPYVCAEWDFGGFPAWLLRTPTMKVRSTDPDYEKFADRYIHHLGEQLAPLQVTRGGPIIMVQLENEYGSYGKDKAYLGHLRDVLKSEFEVPLFTADGAGSMMAAGSLDGVLPGLNGGSGPGVFKEINKYRPTGPYLVPEFYPGWLDHWGERHSTSGTQAAADGFKWLLDHNISANLYMFHGGTNWAGMSGANFGGHYQPQPTSYDYDAPLDEAGRITPKYLALRKEIIEHLGSDVGIPAVPENNPVIAISPIAMEESVSFFDQLPRPVQSDEPMTMEELNQNYGYVLYRTTLPNLKDPVTAKLTIHGLRDYGQVFISGNPVATLDRRLKQESIVITPPSGMPRLEILVEDDGRVNYGRQILDNHKGITGDVTLGDKTLVGWQSFSLPLPDVEKLKFDKGTNTRPPALFHGTFNLEKVGDTFLDLRGWTKGWVWVNGHNLGRYWFIGPQQTLYVPGPWLNAGENSIVVLEQEKLPAKLAVQGLTEPILNQVVKVNVGVKIQRWKQAPALPDSAMAAGGEFPDTAKPQEVKFAPRTGRYLCLQSLSSQKGDNFASAAEINAFDENGKLLPRVLWAIAYADSEENLSDDNAADNVLDGDTETLWHTRYNGTEPPHPHLIVIDLGEERNIGGLRYTPRPTDSPGRIKGYKVFVFDKQ